MNLYVSNLSYTVSDDELRGTFEAYGAVSSARVIMDRETGRSRGFAFVEMPDNNEATAAINALNNRELSGRPLKVVEARPKEPRPAGGGGYGGGGGGTGRSFGGGGGGGGGGARRDFGGGGGGGGGGGRDKDRGWDRGDRGRGRRGGHGDDDEGW